MALTPVGQVYVAVFPLELRPPHMRRQEPAVDERVRTHAPVPVGVVCRSNKSKRSDKSNRSSRSSQDRTARSNREYIADLHPPRSGNEFFMPVVSSTAAPLSLDHTMIVRSQSLASRSACATFPTTSSLWATIPLRVRRMKPEIKLIYLASAISGHCTRQSVLSLHSSSASDTMDRDSGPLSS